MPKKKGPEAWHYEVTYAQHGKRFCTLVEGLRFAVDTAKVISSLMPPLVWDEAGVVVAVVTDDANGLTCHRLVPEQHVEDDDKVAWNLIGGSPGFNRQPGK